MPDPIEFGEINFEQIEYRNEYRHTKAVFFSSITSLLSLIGLLRESGVLAWLGGLGLAAYVPLIVFLLVKMKSRMIITGSGVRLRRPLLKDIEIAYSEMSEITFEDGWLGPGKILTTLNLSEPQPRWEIKRQEEGGKLIMLGTSEPLSSWAQKQQEIPVTNKARVTIRSRDGQKQIKLDQSLEYFEAFSNDLRKRHQLALARYQGYAKGTALRQPERYVETRGTLLEQENRAAGGKLTAPRSPTE
jgi:hypothetical protein